MWHFRWDELRVYLTPTRPTSHPVTFNNRSILDMSIPDMSLAKVRREGPVAHVGNRSRIASLPQTPHHIVKVHDGFELPVRLSASARRTNACHVFFFFHTCLPWNE